MKLLIVGHKQHGKDTVAVGLAKLLGVTYESSSEIVINRGLFDDFIDEEYADAIADHDMDYARKLFYQHRDMYRTFMFRKIQEFNTPDKTALARLILRDHDIYCGMRCRRELLACKEVGLFDCIIFVDAQGRKEFESSSSMTVKPTDADIILGNSGSKADLSDKLESLVALLRATY